MVSTAWSTASTRPPVRNERPRRRGAPEGRAGLSCVRRSWRRPEPPGPWCPPRATPTREPVTTFSSSGGHFLPRVGWPGARRFGAPTRRGLHPGCARWTIGSLPTAAGSPPEEALSCTSTPRSPPRGPRCAPTVFRARSALLSPGWVRRPACPACARVHFAPPRPADHFPGETIWRDVAHHRPAGHFPGEIIWPDVAHLP